jgi:hypothetical protein
VSKMTKAHWRQWMEQWKRAAPALEEVRRKELRSRGYDFRSADTLLEMGDLHGRSRPTSGMVEMQRLFLKLARQQGLVPTTVREKPAEYHAGSRAGTSRKKSGNPVRRRGTKSPDARKSQR